MKQRVVICGAGFGGLELASRLDADLADAVDITLIDRSDSFVFGFSKLDVMFGGRSPDEVRHFYRDIAKPSVSFRRETVTAIDPAARRVTTDRATYEADILVVALGADYDTSATPGLDEGGYEFYSVAGAERAGRAIAAFEGGRIVVGILGPMFKCPPAPFEAAFLLNDHFSRRGMREAVTIEVVSPLPSPIPISEETSAAIVRALDDRGIGHRFGEAITSLDPAAKTAHTKSGDSITYDLFLAIPRHVAPDVVERSGLCVDGWIAVDAKNLRTTFEGVWAVGDVTNAPVPRAGVFAENAAGVVAADIAAALGRGDPPAPFEGRGSCYIEFGGGDVGKVDANFLGGPTPQAPLRGPGPEYAEEKAAFAPQRHARWFGP